MAYTSFPVFCKQSKAFRLKKKTQGFRDNKNLI